MTIKDLEEMASWHALTAEQQQVLANSLGGITAAKFQELADRHLRWAALLKEMISAFHVFVNLTKE